MTVSDQPFKPILNTVLYEQLQRQRRIEAIEDTDYLILLLSSALCLANLVVCLCPLSNAVEVP